MKLQLAIYSQEEATIKLAAENVHRKVIHAQHHLTLCLAEEYNVLGQLYLLCEAH